MKKYKILIGIDGGMNTGVCIIDEPEQQVKFWKTNFWGLIKYLHYSENKKDMFVVIEDPSLIKCIFGDKSKLKKSKAYTAEIGSRVGNVKRETTLIIEYLKLVEIAFKAVPPLNNKGRGAGKMKAPEFEMKYGIGLTLNDHCRDAYKILFHNANINIQGKKLIKIK